MKFSSRTELVEKLDTSLRKSYLSYLPDSEFNSVVATSQSMVGKELTDPDILSGTVFEFYNNLVKDVRGYTSNVLEMHTIAFKMGSVLSTVYDIIKHYSLMHGFTDIDNVQFALVCEKPGQRLLYIHHVGTSTVVKIHRDYQENHPEPIYTSHTLIHLDKGAMDGGLSKHLKDCGKVPLIYVFDTYWKTGRYTIDVELPDSGSLILESLGG